MEIIRVHIGIYHEIVYSASWFNILNFLGFASEFNRLNPLGFVDYFMINTSWALIIPIKQQSYANDQLRLLPIKTYVLTGIQYFCIISEIFNYVLQ